MDIHLSYRPFLRLWAFVVLLLIVYNAAGHAVVFTAIRYTVRQEVKALLKKGVPESDLHVLSIPLSVEHSASSSFQRIHDGEFRYKGRLYDIVRREMRGDTTVYYCINDTAEEQLFADLDEHVRSALPSSNAAKSTSPLAALKLVIKEAMAPSGISHIWPHTSRLMAATELHKYYAVTPDIPTPPPRRGVS